MPRLMLALILAAMPVLAAAPAIPLRWAISDPQPVIHKSVQPSKFAESVGQRAAILGREDGQFEAWVYPIKIASGFRLSVYFDGALEPVPLSEMAEHFAAGPGRVTITHSHAAFTVKQTWVASIDEPVLAVLLDIETARPLRLRASLTPEMKPMWPASFGGQTSDWDDEAKALTLGEATRSWSALIGCPAVSRVSEQVGHQLPDRTVLLELDVTPESARRHIFPFVITGGRGRDKAKELYSRAIANLPGLLSASDAYYREFDRRTLTVKTPDAVINSAFEWAKYALDKGWACNDGVGCGLIAGWAASGFSERPGFGWYFGGDALMNSWSILDYGDPRRVRALLEFLRDHQRADGKMMHEWTQSGALLDWTKFPYGYYHADTTALYLFSAARYVRESGDVEFLNALWPSLEKAYQFCVHTLDDDGLMSNRKAGAAAVETGALSGRVAKDVYLAGVWLAGLDGYRLMAELRKDTAQTAEATERLARARTSMNAWFSDPKGYLPFGRLTDGSLYDALSGWQAIALAYGGLDPEKSARAAQSLNLPALSSDWGTRLFATDSPSYDPLSYNDGSVWPFVTGFVASAEYANRKPFGAFQHLFGLAAMTGLSGAGFLTEYLSGDRAQALPRAVPHQLFSSAAIIHPLVTGLLGLQADAVNHILEIAPQLPANWSSVEFGGYRVGATVVGGEIRRAEGRIDVQLKMTGQPLRVLFRPVLPPGVAAQPVKQTAPALQSSASFEFAEGVEMVPDLVVPAPGDRSRAARLLNWTERENSIEFTIAAPSGSSQRLRFRCGPAWTTEGGVREGAAMAVPVVFPAAGGEFITKTVRFVRSPKPV